MHRVKTTASGKSIIGWREWVVLPELGTPPIKAKVDTGARTSALHAFHIKEFTREGVEFVKFFVHPVQHRRKPQFECEAKVLERRCVTSSTGHKEFRYVIETILEMGGHQWPIELTLTNRDELGFRMLVGRQAIRSKFIVDPGKSYCTDLSEAEPDVFHQPTRS